MIRRPPRSTQSRSSAASDVYKRQGREGGGRLGEVFDEDAGQFIARCGEVEPAVLVHVNALLWWVRSVGAWCPDACVGGAPSVRRAGHRVYRERAVGAADGEPEQLRASETVET